MRIAEEEHVVVESAAGVESATVVDFSASGAEIDLSPEASYRVGENIKVRYLGAWMHAQVARVSGSREKMSIGIQWQNADPQLVES